MIIREIIAATLCVIVLLTIIYIIVRTKTEGFEQQKNTIYCIMITGKTTKRIDMARVALKNFESQTHPRKRLIIINHHPDQRVMESTRSVTERRVPRNTTLGRMRNLAMEMVPLDALWTTWDDDDVRAPEYLSTLYASMIKNRADVVTFTDRIEYNLNTDFVWQMTLESGFVLVLARNSYGFRYDDERNTMEDTHILDHHKKLGARLHVIKGNDPMLYIRLVHGYENTSLYANKAKKGVRVSHNTAYKETDVDEAVAKRVREAAKVYKFTV